MSSTTSAARSQLAARSTTKSRHNRNWRRWILIFTSVAIASLCIVAILGIRCWPFSEASVIKNLSEAADSTVTVRRYHPTYFPPGCILEGVEFRHDRFQLITVERLVIEGSYPGILARHIPRITADAARVFIPPLGSDVRFHSQHSSLVVDKLIANGSLVEVLSDDPHRPPLRFDVHEAFLNSVRWGKPITYQLKFHNPNPPAELAVRGQFGAWTDGHPQDTPMSGEYSFDHADLGVYRGIAGTLSSTGRFDGVFKHVNVSGTTDTPDFEVTSGGHKVKLTTKFDAYVDVTRGDTFLNRVEARFRRTTVIAHGSIAGSQGQNGKFAKLRLSSRNGRIEDILGLFVRPARCPMSGAMSLAASVEIPPDGRSFLERVKLNGSFGIDDGSFSTPETQRDVDALSAGARGMSKEDPETVLTDLKGNVDLSYGVAKFSDLAFQVPGAFSRLHGTYNILNHKVDLHGEMRVDTKISKTSTGMKSLFLKVMDPFFKKKKKGEIVPVHILGTYEKPLFGLDLMNDQAKPK